MFQEYARDGKLSLVVQKGKHGEEPLSGAGLIAEFIFNGTVHFGQNIIAFVLLSLVSPVTYSVASLVKRIFVIVMAIVWFGNKTTPVQAVGIALTYVFPLWPSSNPSNISTSFLGLYLYDRAGDVARKERHVQTRGLDPLLPSHADANSTSKQSAPVGRPRSGTNGYAVGPDKDGSVGVNGVAWLPPGTRQEETWRPRETVVSG